VSAPVVRCVIGIPPDGKARRHVITAEYATTVREGDLPALAVPDALWNNEEFRDAVDARCAEVVAMADSFNGIFDSVVDAIHAELRARAGGAA
jgi:hypothetical protein